ncbi:hypothetical protein L873DRAFT_1032545 [Choiromyces venosus 120613-1]|uniref:Uncharacterized protein n=1 Tax=Choiromyces venosus 120613-1 TaxID=1336337 RepID=A0A3N4JJU1_9PEZI|nr:hypothetical protein L873DRAFT_1032545 [Choiromyces venosus 120613-1]
MTDSTHQSRPQSSSGQRPRSRSPSRLTKLTTSSSYPCIPLLASRAAASSPPAVTSAVAFGSTSATSALPSPNPWIHSAETIEDDSPRTPGSILERPYSGFPWGLHFKEQPHTNSVILGSGAQTFAGELSGAKTRSSVLPHPPLPHTKLDPTHTAVRTKRSPSRGSPKSSLKLKLPPPPHMVDDYGLAPSSAQQGKRAENDGVFIIGQENHRLRSSLLGVAFPTTPDTSVNSMPVICAGISREGKRAGHIDFRGGMGLNHEVIGAGGATAALLAANPHLAPGGLAPLTPPDDNGILEWRGEGMSELLVPVIPTALAKDPACAAVCDSEDSKPVLPGKTPAQRRIDVLKSPEETERTARITSGESTETTETRREVIDEKEEASVGKSGDNSDNESRGHEDIVEEGWLKGAMTSLFDCALSVQMTTEAVRMLSYTLPCPLPTTSTDSGTPTPIPSNLGSNPDRLPASAAAAPAVAAAAGQQFSPAITARCHSRAHAGSGSSTPSGLIGADDGITTALHTLTRNIRRRCSNEGTKRVYIHVSHAISPSIPLNRLPSTPPTNGCVGSPGGFFGGGFDTSPGGYMGGGGGGYFAPTVFNSIVVAPESVPAAPSMSSHRSHTIPPPNPILPPFSLHMTLLERYIPPTSNAEDVSMFSTQSSVILDRLHELSPHGGSLLFIYPTKTGAKHFDKQYLGPVLDPLLRKLMVLYMLREDLLWGIRNMAAIEKMNEFEGLRHRLGNFCSKFSHAINDNSMWGKSSSGSQASRLQLDSNYPKTRVRLVYSQKAMIQLNDNSWREWWSQQEQLRIREAVKRHFSSLQPPAEAQTPASPSASSPHASHHAKSASMSSPKLGSFPSMAQTAKATTASSTPSSPTVSSSPQSQYSFGYGAPGDLAREVLDGVRAPAVRPSSRGMSEAVVASALAGSGTFGVGGVVGDYEISSVPGDRRVKERGIEVGVFVLRREIVT